VGSRDLLSSKKMFARDVLICRDRLVLDKKEGHRGCGRGETARKYSVDLCGEENKVRGNENEIWALWRLAQ